MKPGFTHAPRVKRLTQTARFVLRPVPLVALALLAALCALPFIARSNAASSSNSSLITHDSSLAWLSNPRPYANDYDIFNKIFASRSGRELATPVVPWVSTTLVINEIDYDQVGTDTAEFVELKNVSGGAINLDNYTVELVNGNAGGAAVYDTIDLPNVNLAAGDYYVICANTTTVINCDLDDGPDTDFIQNGSPDAVGLRLSGTLIDAASYEGNSGAPYTESTGTPVATGSDSNTVAFIGLSRFADGVDTDNNSADVTLRCITPGVTNSSASSGCTAPVAPASTTTTVLADDTSVDAADLVTFTATVSSGTAGTITGTVQIKSDGTDVGSPGTLSGSPPFQAFPATRCITVGTHTITAVYSGDSNYATSTGTMLGSETVSKPAIVVVDDSFVAIPDCANMGANGTVSAGFLIFNRNAFPTISTGLLGVSSTGTVHVNAGIYTENVTVPAGQVLTLDGDAVINGDLALNGTLNVGTHTLTLNGAVSGTGTLTSDPAGTVNYNQASNGQNVLAADYGNLNFSSFNKTLASTGTIGIRTSFNPGNATGHTVTGSTIEYHLPTTSSDTTILPFTFFVHYHNLKINELGNTVGPTGLVVDGALTLVQGTFTSASDYNDVNIGAGTTLSLSAPITVSGNWDNDGTFNAGTNAVTFDGTANQTIGGDNVSQFHTLNISNTGTNPNNVVSLTQHGYVSTTLHITGGVFDLNGKDLQRTGNVTVDANTTFRDLGASGTITMSGNMANSGTVNINAHGATCPDPDDILITSLSHIQRAWSGSGTFTLTDVTVEDQGGTAVITVHSGTAGTNNGLFWFFVASCVGTNSYVWTPDNIACPTVQNNDWQCAGNWNPARATTSSSDVLIFDGSVTLAPTVLNIPSETIAALILRSNVNPATFNANTLGGTKTLTISGGAANDLSVPIGTLLKLVGTTGLQLSLTSGSTGSVGGQIQFQDNGPHQLLTSGLSTVTFTGVNGFTSDSTYSATTHPFGDGTGSNNNSIIFASGSTYTHGNGLSPFGTAANSVVNFNTGSTARYLTATGFDANGRTYANLTIGDGSSAVLASDSGSGNFTFDNLTINNTAGALSKLEFAGNGGSTVTIKGNITSNSGPGNAPDVFLTAGTGGIVFDKSGGTISLTDNSLNSRGVLLSSNATVNTGTTLALARVLQMGLSADKTLTVNDNLVGSAGGYIVGFESLNFACPTTCSKTFHVGTTNGYSPIDEDFSNGSGSYVQTVKAFPGQLPGISGANALQRYWNITTPSGLNSLTANITFHYLGGAPPSGDIPATATESNFKIFRKTGAGVFSEFTPDDLNTTNHTAKLNNVSSFSDWTLAEPAAVAEGSLAFFDGATSNVTEGNAGPTVKTVKVTRSGGTDGAVTVQYATSDGTATLLDNDYVAASGTLSWAAGEGGEKSFDVTINGDTNVEPTETINITLSSPTGGVTIAQAGHIVNVTNDDVAAPEINIQGNGVTIANNDTTPDAADHTDFGSTDVSSGSVVRTFTIQNTGPGTLNIFDITVTGQTGGGLFTPSAAASATVAPSGSTTFTVTFDPSTPGLKSATVSVYSDDGDEGTYSFKIEGTGTVASGCTPPSVVYVDDSWVGTTPGTDPDAGGPATNFGCDSFATIQDGINGVASGGTINVYAGAYPEQIEINKPVTMLGPNANINPNTGTRVAEAVIMPTASDPVNPSFGGPMVVAFGTNGTSFVGTNGITFKGFTVDGNNPSLTSGVIYNGVDVDAEFGIYGTETANPDAIIQNNIVQNIGEIAIWINSNGQGGAKNANSRITENKVDNDLGIFGQGIRISDDAWMDVTDNVVTRVRNGIVIENYSGNTTTHPASVISNNNVTSFRIGIRHNLHYVYAAPGFTISNNTVQPYVQSPLPPAVGASPTAYQGIRVESIQQTVFVTVEDNTLVGNRTAMQSGGYTRDEGLYVTNASATSPNILFNQNDVRDFIRGAFHETPAVPDFECNNFAFNTTGILIDAAATNGLIAHNNNITGNGFGMQNNSSSVVNAENNYWGSSTGPTIGTNPGGTGDAVSTNVDYDPFLPSPAGCAAVVSYTITASAGPNGSISPSGAVSVAYGASQTFNITANPSYHIADVLVDSVSVGPVASYTFNNVTANHTIAASFAINTYTITASAGPNGSISPSGAVIVNSGDNQTFNITANTNFHIQDVLVDSVSVGPVASYTFNNVTANHTISASFAQTCVTPSTVYVDDDWVGTPVGADPDGGGPATNFGCDSFATVQGGVNGVATGGTVIVYAGTYNEDVAINNNGLQLLGAGAGVTTISGPIGGPGTTVQIFSNNVTVAGFTITRAGNNTTDWNNPGLNSAGFAIQGTSITGALIRDNVITGNRTGIDINNSSGHTIRNNVIDFNRTGLIFRNQTDRMTVIENFITNNWTVGVLFLDASGGTNSPVQSATGSAFSNNDISGNWYGQIVDRQSGGSLPAPGTTNLKYFRGDWFGTTAPIVTTANSAEPGYAAQIPVAYGGTATPPGGQPDIAGPASANFQYTPFLKDGTDTNVETVPGRGTNGFQGVPNVVIIRETNLQGWTQQHSTCGAAGTGSQAFVFGPGTPPSGVGSLQYLIGANGDSFETARTPDFNDVRVDALTSLSYATYVVQDGSGGQAPYLLLNIDYTGDNVLDDQIFFEPVYQSAAFFPSNPQGPLVVGAWQTWDALNGGWWSLNNIAGAGPGTNVKSLAQYLAAQPNARVLNTGTGTGAFRIATGCGAGAWDNFIGDADNLFVAVKTASIRYDLEPVPRISIDDVTHNEGDASTTSYTFNVTLSGPSDQTITVNYETVPDSATAPSDYTAIPSTPITFNPGETSKPVTVLVNGETTFEPHEQFFVNLSGAVNATILDGQGVGTITNDDPQPTVTIDDLSQAEGSAGGTTAFNFTVNLSNASSSNIDVNYSTQDNTAKQPGDYAAASNTLTIPAGSTSGTITVQVVADDTFEPNETFFVNLTGSTGSTIGDNLAIGTIQNDDAGPTFSIDNVSMAEGDAGTTNFVFTVTKTGATAERSRVDFATANGTTNPATGGASCPGSDYVSQSGTLAFTPAETMKTVTVVVCTNGAYELNETFFVNLSNPVNASIATGQGVGTINNDDAAPTITISDKFPVNEGTTTPPATTPFTFTLTRTGSTEVGSTVTWSTADGTPNPATGGGACGGSVDYLSVVGGTVTFPASGPGSTSQTLTVNVCRDSTFELDETFFVNLTSATDATIADNQALATIKNDDNPGSTLVVNTTNDFNDGTCDGTHCSLREAINAANASPSPVTITFAIPASAAQHLYYTDDNTGSPGTPNGTVTLANISITAATDDTTISGIDPDWPHSWWSIQPGSALPALTNSNAIVIDGYSQCPNPTQCAATNDGTASPGTNAVLRIELVNGSSVATGLDVGGGGSSVKGLVINGFTTQQLSLSSSSKTISGNFIGTDVSGTVARGGGYGISSTANNSTIGGTGPDAVNLISGNASAGVALSNSSQMFVQGNLIGTKRDGVTGLGNGNYGINLTGNGSAFNILGGPGVGEANIIAFNSSGGVSLLDLGGGNTIRGNSIYSNGTTAANLGIDLGADGVTANDAGDGDTGPNGLQNFPVIRTALVGTPNQIRGTLNSIANQTYTIDLYANTSCDDSGNGEGKRYLGSTTSNTGANGDGLWSFSPAPGSITASDFITATATDNLGSTSEFSACFQAANFNSGTLQFVGAPYTDNETNADHTVTITVSRTGGSSGAVDVTYGTSDGSAMLADNDYVAASGTLHWNNAETGNKTFTITVKGDTIYEADETINITLGTPTNGASVTGPNPTTLTITNDDAPTISARDAQVAEPASGTAQMLFTVILEGVAQSTVTVNYATANGGPTPASGGGVCSGLTDYVNANGTLTFAPGERVKTVAVTICSEAVTPEADETLLLNISGASAGTIARPQATGTITQVNSPGTILVSELRTSGPGGPGDDFVEIYNNTNAQHTVAASDASPGYGVFKIGSDCNATPVLIGTIPNGTPIPARGHFLLVGSQYSLAPYATGDVTLTQDIEADRNVAIFTTTDINQLSSLTRLDAVGFGTNTGGGVCDLFRESTPLPPALGSATEHTFLRKLCDYVEPVGCQTPGIPKDTNSNGDDLMFVDTAGTLIIGGPPQRLGAPGPENLASPLRRDPSINVVLLDVSQPQSAPPNRVRDVTNDTANASDFGTLSVRRRVVNNTANTVTRLRFRIVELTTFPPPSGRADLRARSSLQIMGVAVNDPATCAATGTPATAPCTVDVNGTTLEQPPNQADNIGAGYNATLAAGSITITPLAPGASTNVHFLLGVKTTGTFRFLIIVEALP